MSPRARQAKNKARIKAYEEMADAEFQDQPDRFEIQIPPTTAARRRRTPVAVAVTTHAVVTNIRKSHPLRRRPGNHRQATGQRFQDDIAEGLDARLQQAEGALKFFNWAFSNGDKMSEELDYVPLPPAVEDMVRQEIRAQRVLPARPVQAVLWGRPVQVEQPVQAVLLVPLARREQPVQRV